MADVVARIVAGMDIKSKLPNPLIASNGIDLTVNSVKLTDVKVDPPTKEGTLSMEAVAKTYRYLDDEEISKQKKSAKDKSAAKGAKK